MNKSKQSGGVSEAARLMGKARMAKMTPEEMHEYQSAGGKARAKALSAKRRSQIARNAALARHKKKSGGG